MSFNEAINPYTTLVRNNPNIQDSLEETFQSFRGQYSIVDLGCGNGHFLTEYVRSQPQFSGLGVERRYKRTFKTAQKVSRLPDPTTVKVIRAEIEDFFHQSPEEFWDEIWMQFPDPWPKARHEKNRLVRPENFVSIFKLLKRGGRFCFRSDCRSYWELLQRMQSITDIFDSISVMTGDMFLNAPKTLFQRRFENRQTPIYSLELRKSV